jgi:hypothetical protein
MRKITLIALLVFFYAGMNYAQTVIADFEHIQLNLMQGGEEDNSTMVVVPNPDQSEANPSTHVVKFTRSQHGVPWGGFWSRLPETIDLTTNKYIHVQVWKPRVSPVKFKVEGGTTPNYELESVEPQTLTEEWETIVFHFPDATGEYPIVAFMPDFADPVDLTQDIVIYFDNIIITNSAVLGSDPLYVIEDFEHIELNLLAGGEEDNSSMVVIANPDPTGVNTSEHVVQFNRSQFGVPWGGFWSRLPEPLDLSQSKFVYVDVWKSRISPLKFKIEDGPSDNLEIESVTPQTKVEEWETIVFDFSEKEGQWNVIAFMPDFSDPVGLTEDIVIYFDNIRVGAAPTNISEPLIRANELFIEAFPNPAQNNLEIKTQVGSTVSLVNLSGSIIRSQVAETGNLIFDISNLPQGIYLVRVINHGNVATKKVVVN